MFKRQRYPLPLNDKTEKFLKNVADLKCVKSHFQTETHKNVINTNQITNCNHIITVTMNTLKAPMTYSCYR